MTTINMHRAQILRQPISHVLKGKVIRDGVGALEMVIADLLMPLPGASERSTLAVFDAMASDVRAIIAERYATQIVPN